MPRWLTVLTAVLLLGACTERVAVTQADPILPGGVDLRLAGRYVARVQTGGWHLTVAPAGIGCRFMQFDADINAAWEQAMRDALALVLEQVEFQVETPTPEHVRERGYDAGIVIYQGNAVSSFTIEPEPAPGRMRSDVQLTIILGVMGRGGVSFQRTVESSSAARQPSRIGCSKVSVVVVEATRQAVGTVARDTARQLREVLQAQPPRRSAGP